MDECSLQRILTMTLMMQLTVVKFSKEAGGTTHAAMQT